MECDLFHIFDDWEDKTLKFILAHQLRFVVRRNLLIYEQIRSKK